MLIGMETFNKQLVTKRIGIRYNLTALNVRKLLDTRFNKVTCCSGIIWKIISLNN